MSDAGRVESAVSPPQPGWARRLPRDESLFLWLLLVVGVAMSAFAIGWVYFHGNQRKPSSRSESSWNRSVPARPMA